MMSETWANVPTIRMKNKRTPFSNWLIQVIEKKRLNGEAHVGVQSDVWACIE